MSREASASRDSATSTSRTAATSSPIHTPHTPTSTGNSPYNETHSVGSNANNSRIVEQMALLSMSAPSTSVVMPTLSRDTIHSDEVAIQIEDETKEKSKKNRKSIDESQRKRKDTAGSLSNFFHRLTRGITTSSINEEKKEDYAKTPIEEEEKGEDKIERPERLPNPDEQEEKWFETNLYLKSVADGADYKTALERDKGHEGNAEIYEWKADSLEERLHTEYPPQLPHQEWAEQEGIEQSLDELLEEFRSGHMRALTDNQLEKLRELKREHERVTNMHIQMFEMDDASRKAERMKEMYSQLTERVFQLHKMMDGPFFN